jgi:hypothetical protein
MKLRSKWNGLNRNKRPRHVRPETHARNLVWREICMERAQYLIKTYGYLVCEYSGERIDCLSLCYSSPHDGWGHHIDGNRNHAEKTNAFIVKYKYHQLITERNLQVEQESFIGAPPDIRQELISKRGY